MPRGHHQPARSNRRVPVPGPAMAILAAIALAVSTVGPLPASGQVGEQPGVVIDFEDLPFKTAGEFQVISYVEVTDFYRERGVTFDPPVLGIRFGPSESLELSSFAASGSSFVAPQCPESIVLPQAALVSGVCRPVAMRFDRELTSVSVLVGAAPSNENRTVTLEALDANGDAIAGESVEFPETGDLTPIETPLTVTIDDGGVFGARLYWIGGSTTAFYVDDVALVPFEGVPDIEVREPVPELDAGDLAQPVSTTVVFDNVGTGPAAGHRLRLVASEPFGDSVQRQVIECPDPLERGASCAVEVILDPATFPLAEAGPYTGGAALSFVGSNGEILESVDFDVRLVVSEPASSTPTPTDENDPNTTRRSPDGDPDPEPNPAAWLWLGLVAIGAVVFRGLRRRRRRASGAQIAPPPPAPPPPPASLPPPPSGPPTPAPYRITIRNAEGRQQVTRDGGPLVVITATRSPGRVTVSQTTEAVANPAVSITEGDSP